MSREYASPAFLLSRGSAPPYPGNRGLLVVDMPAGAVFRLAMPEGFQRTIGGTNRHLQAGSRMFGVIQLMECAFGV